MGSDRDSPVRVSVTRTSAEDEVAGRRTQSQLDRGPGRHGPTRAAVEVDPAVVLQVGLCGWCRRPQGGSRAGVAVDGCG